MAILTDSGRIGIAAAIKDRPAHLAWGTGAAGGPGTEAVEATVLVAEIGRRQATLVQFVRPDATGEVIVPGGRFTASIAPTNILHMRFDFDYAEAADAVITELGVFLGTEVDPGCPPGQEYFGPAEIVDPGILFQIEHIADLERSASTRQTFDFVVTI